MYYDIFKVIDFCFIDTCAVTEDSVSALLKKRQHC